MAAFSIMIVPGKELMLATPDRPFQDLFFVWSRPQHDFDEQSTNFGDRDRYQRVVTFFESPFMTRERITDNVA